MHRKLGTNEKELLKVLGKLASSVSYRVRQKDLTFLYFIFLNGRYACFNEQIKYKLKVPRPCRAPW